MSASAYEPLSIATPEITDSRYTPDEVWNHFSARSAGDGEFLELTAWIHDRTAWISARGELNDSTAPTLRLVFARVRPLAPHRTVLDLSELSALDHAGIRAVSAEHLRLRHLHRSLEIVSARDVPDARTLGRQPRILHRTMAAALGRRA